jgi:hypothetical protein
LSNRRAEPFPLRISASNCWRSSPLNRTTYFFTEISFAAMIDSIAISGDGSESQNPSNWLKQATSCHGHFNPEGNRRVAEIISQYAERKKLLDD